MTTTPRFALFREGQQISKAHSTWQAAIAEAYAHGAIINCGADFPGDKEARRALANGYEIRETVTGEPSATIPAATSTDRPATPPSPREIEDYLGHIAEAAVQNVDLRDPKGLVWGFCKSDNHRG